MIDEDSLQFIKEHADARIDWLAEKTGYCGMTVRRHLEAMGLYKAKHITDKMVEYVLNHTEMTDKDIAHELGISAASVSNIKIAHGLRKHAKHIF